MGEPAKLLMDINPIGDWWRSLPFQLTDVSVFESIRPVGFRFRKHAYNISGFLKGKSLVVTGEANNQELAITKAVAEFIERCALFEFACNHSDVKSSNGWAAHTDPVAAQENAIRELVERDAVLRHWYSMTPFFEITNSTLPESILSWKDLDLSRSEFPDLKILVSHLGCGPSVTALLLNENGFGVAGHCSKESLMEAIDGAIEEACRMAEHYLLNSFLEDTIKLKSQLSAKVETGAHGVYHAHQKPFPKWLRGKLLDFTDVSILWMKKNSDLFKSKNQFTTLEACADPLYVVQAKNKNVIELSWGYEKLEILKARVSGKISNINEKNLNLEPHIIP